MVFGADIAVTAEALMYQCAETTRIARGLGTSAPNVRQASVYRLWSSAFIGVPWPKNAVGNGVTSLPHRSAGTMSSSHLLVRAPAASHSRDLDIPGMSLSSGWITL